MEVLVEYEYIAVEEDELTIRRGDIISNVERLSDGWMEGDMDGRRGAFPDNFVKVVKEAQPQEIKKDDKVKSKEAPKKAGGGHVADLANKLGHQGIKMGPPPNGTAGKVTKRDQSRRKLRAKVAFSYAPANDDELRLEPGDVVEVLKQEEEGWWEGSVNGKTGMFPSNFVELVAQEAEAEDKNAIANDKDKKKVMGVGLGDIFKDGPINLRPTGEKTKTAPERTEPRPLPTAKPEEKSLSLKKNTPVKQPPALPPKDVTETKRVSPIMDADERFPAGPGQREHSTSPSTSALLLESIPELDTATEITNRQYSRPSTLGVAQTKKAPKRVSHVLDSFYYSEDDEDDDEEYFGDCPHGDDFDHTSLDDEGCQYSPDDDEFSEVLNSESIESTTPFSSFVEKEVKSPMSDLRIKCMNVNFLDGRKSGASRASSGSDVPIDVSELSQTRATPPPKFTFRKRRAKGTPNTPVTKSKPLQSQTASVIEAEKPPRKRPRKFLSTTGVVWTTSTDPLDKEIVHQLYDLNASAPEGYRSPPPDEGGVYSEGKNYKEADFWVTEFSPVPKKRPPAVQTKKSVSFASKDNLIDQQGKGVSVIYDAKLPLQSIQARHIFKAINVKKITDSVELNKEKMRSGKWKKAVEAKHKKIQTTEDFLQRPTLGKGTSLRKSLSERISAVISPSLRRSKTETSLTDDSTPLDLIIEDGTKPDLNHEGTVVSEQKEPSKETIRHIDVVSATSKPMTDVVERVASLRRSVHLEQLAEKELAKPPKSRWSPIKKRLSSPLSKFRQSRFNLRKKVSPQKSPLKQEIIDGSTYVRMPGVEPTYLETLKDMGRLSPSVRQLSQRYCLFQKGNMSKSLDFLATSANSVDNVNDVTASLPQLPNKYSHFTTEKEIEPTSEVIEDEGTVSTQITENVKEKTKNKRSSKRLSFFSGFGTWPRRVPSPEITEVDSGYSDDKSPEPSVDEAGKKSQNGAKRKRFSLLRPRLSGDSKTLPHVYNADTNSKPERRSLFNSLRRRFSTKKKTSKLESTSLGQFGHEGMATEYSYDRPLEILTDNQRLPASDHFHENAQHEMRRRSNLHQNKNQLWKVESSPEHGEKWIALKDPSLAPQLSRRSVVKTEAFLPHSSLYKQHSDDELEEMEHKVKHASPTKMETSTSDAFWSRIDQGISHEEVVDLDDYVVVDDLNQLVHDKSLEDAAEALVQEAIWKAMGETQRQKFSTPAEFNRFIWSQSRRTEPTTEQPSLCDIEKIAKTVAVAVLHDISQDSIPEHQHQDNDNKPPYYRMMTDGYQSLAAEVLLNNEGNQGVSNISNNNTNMFNDGGVQFLNMSDSTDKCDDCSELVDLVDAYFGQDPSPISPQQAREMQQRMLDYVKYHEDHMTSRSPGSLSAGTPNNTFSSLTAQEEDGFYDFEARHNHSTSPVTYVQQFNRSYSMEQKPAGSTFYGSPEPSVADAARHKDEKPAGSTFYGTPEPLETDTSKYKGHEPASCMSYGDIETTHYSGSDRRQDIDASPVTRDPNSRVAGSYFIVKSPWEVSAALKKVKSSSEIETSTPKLDKCRRRSTGWWININEDTRPATFRPSWTSPAERPIGIHFGTPSKKPMVDTSPIPKHQRRSIDEKPVGIHGGFTFEALEEQTTEDYSEHSSVVNGGGFPLSKSVASMHLATANTTVTENSYYSLDGTQSTINFSSSSIINQLP